ncbi:phage tail protein [Pantoea sp. ACRSB]|uniref:phage tail protein n=1 Tax=Pantoea sp. ACRSB TaxID=2918207 RepID=UPI0028930B4D|nr:phage tail protein [Pantoea sp. ACRSB]MCG7388743.1 phage tail protein [Pantoea sp. ACRSB]
MYDIHHYVGGDLSTSPAGDLRPVSGTERGRQRILRRLMTNPGEYVFHPDYGAGLGQKVGQNVNLNEWKTLISGQMLLEDAVAASPPPTVALSLIEGGVSVAVAYTDASTGTPETLSFDVTR